MIKKNAAIKFFVVFSFLFLSYDAAFANLPGQGPMSGGYMGMGWMMFLFWGLVLGILILVIRWVLNLPQREKRFSGTEISASQILNERFVKGEIDIDEFELKKQIIAD